jgi:hypothetical protein
VDSFAAIIQSFSRISAGFSGWETKGEWLAVSVRTSVGLTGCTRRQVDQAADELGDGLAHLVQHEPGHAVSEQVIRWPGTRSASRRGCR